MGTIFTSMSLVRNQQNRLHRGLKEKSEVESVIRVWLYERRKRTNFVYYIAFRYPTKSYSKHKFIACKSFYSKMLNLFPNRIHLNFPLPNTCISLYTLYD